VGYAPSALILLSQKVAGCKVENQLFEKIHD
jgi:hypothetical protein